MLRINLGTADFEVGDELDSVASGHFARVYSGRVRLFDGDHRSVAIKVMKTKHIPDVGIYEAFKKEVEMLIILKDKGVPGLIEMLACGYMFDTLDVEDQGRAKYSGSEALGCGQAKLYDPRTEFHLFEDEYPTAIQNRYLPVLILHLIPQKERNNSLHWFVNQRRPVPVVEGLLLLYKFSDWLSKVHDVGIAYNDFKPAHFYWDGSNFKVIDWNGSLWLNGEGDAFISDMMAEDMYRAVTGFIYPILTGDQLREAAPGDLKMIEMQFKNLNMSAYSPNQQLGTNLNKLVVDGISRNISNASMFSEYLNACLIEWGYLPDTMPNIPELKEMLQVLQQIRHAQRVLQNVLDEIGDPNSFEHNGLQGEMFRVRRRVEEMLNNRVVP